MPDARSKEAGFTLIELLMVIVIIGVLAGVLISILNPSRQQSRAKDGVIVASLNKIVADIRAAQSADISGTPGLPSCQVLRNSLSNLASGLPGCISSNEGVVRISGVVDNSNALVDFRYVRSATVGSNNFCVSTAANDTTQQPFIAVGYLDATTQFTTPQRSPLQCPDAGLIP